MKTVFLTEIPGQLALKFRIFLKDIYRTDLRLKRLPLFRLEISTRSEQAYDAMALLEMTYILQ